LGTRATQSNKSVKAWSFIYTPHIHFHGVVVSTEVTLPFLRMI